MDKIDKYKVVAALVRSFFEAFSSGIVDCHIKTEADRFRPLSVKKAMLNHYEAVGEVFNDTLFYPLSCINYTMDEIEGELRKADMRHATMTDLVKLACRSDAVYAAICGAGRVPAIADHLRLYTRGEGAGSVDTDTAISLTVRTVMLAYARGIRQAGTGKASLHQATVFRLLLEAMTVLLHDRQMSLTGIDETDGLDAIFVKACRSEHNFHVLTREMDRTYGELVESEGIISQDDKAN